jgi:hypothetical protein
MRLELQQPLNHLLVLQSENKVPQVGNSEGWVRTHAKV